MNLLIFRTDIKTKKKVKALTPLFNNHSVIADWSVDLADVDKVLRIETPGGLTEKDIMRLAETYGFFCEPLED